MESLTDEELACLQRFRSETDSQQPCPQAVLDKLMAKGLIEQKRLLALPVQPQRTGYQLTPAGHRVLNPSD